MAYDAWPRAEEFPFLLRDHETRLDEIEKYQPAVMAEQIKQLRIEVRGLKNAMFSVAGGLLLAAISIAFAFHP